MFRTELKAEPSRWKINIRDQILSIGSCFAVNTGQKMLDFKFDALVNPFGVIYNPVSVFKLLDYSLNKRNLDMVGFLENQGVYRHYDLHSDVSAPDRQGLEKLFIENRDLTHHYLTDGKVLVITLGTASVFRHISLETIVANCHKMPDRHFTRHNLDIEEICVGFRELYHHLKNENPGLKFILTVSPVRHLRDSLPASQLSKSILRVAVGNLANELSDVSYFPAYEIMLDDLRDYRYYAPDMLHPNDVAIDYIWDKFSTTYFDAESLEFIREWSKIRKSLLHRPFNPGSAEHKMFLKKTMEQLERFSGMIDIIPEKAILEKKLNE